jgi:hypothetical protein
LKAALNDVTFEVLKLGTDVSAKQPLKTWRKDVTFCVLNNATLFNATQFWNICVMLIRLVEKLNAGVLLNAVQPENMPVVVFTRGALNAGTVTKLRQAENILDIFVAAGRLLNPTSLRAVQLANISVKVTADVKTSAGTDTRLVQL